MNVVFRADASLTIGNGHVMRCLTLAGELRRRGSNCTFICQVHPGHLVEKIRQAGFQVFPLKCEGGTPAGCRYIGEGSVFDWESDARWSLEALAIAGQGAVVDWMIVDHYDLDAKWEHAVSEGSRRLMVIDDRADRPHDCNILLDQNLGRNVTDYKNLVKPNCVVVAGPEYALLRPDFYQLRDESIQGRRNRTPKHFMISMGGVDEGNATGRVLNALNRCKLPTGTHVTVVMGPHAPWIGKINEQVSKMSLPAKIKVDINNMAELMAECDIAIGAAGSTSWERCCLGLPAIVFCLADNQKEAIAALELHRAAVASELQEVDGDAKIFSNKVNFLIENFHQLIQWASEITNGQGCLKISEMLIKQSSG